MSHGDTTRLGTPSEAASALQGMQFGEPLSGYQAEAAAGIVASRLLQRPCKVQAFEARLEDCGDGGGPTVVRVQVNGANLDAGDADVGAISIANDDADPTQTRIPLDVDLDPGDVLTLAVDAGPSANTLDLFLTADVVQRSS